MWRLKSLKEENNQNEVAYILLSNKDYVVGRKDAQILIPGDPSISRKHAVLRVRSSGFSSQSQGSESQGTQLTITDCGSKYGTFLNRDTKLEPNQETLLAPTNTLVFGQLGALFCVEKDPLVVSSSCLEVAQKTALRSALRKLGGQLVVSWQPSCTHLVMPSLKVTIKAISALVSQRPIVTPEYFTAIMECSQSASTDIPLPESFLPPIAEPSLDRNMASFTPLAARATIFSGKTFVCLSARQHKKLTQAITLGGGRTLLWGVDRRPEDFLFQPETCVMQPDPVSSDSQPSTHSQSSVDVAAISALLRSRGKRLIPESDLGLAVVYCTTDNYCNPSLDLGSVLLAEPPPTNPQNEATELLVPETQDQSPQLTNQRMELPSSNISTSSPALQTLKQVEEEIPGFDFLSSPPPPANQEDYSTAGKSAAGDKRKRSPSSPPSPPPPKKSCDDDLSFSGRSSLVLKSPASTTRGNKVAFVRRRRPSQDSSVSSLSLASAMTAKRPRAEDKENCERKSKRANMEFNDDKLISSVNLSPQWDNCPPSTTPKDDAMEEPYLQSSVLPKVEVKKEEPVDDEEEELLCNLTNIRLVSLVLPLVSPSASLHPPPSSVKNFKAFRKVAPVVTRKLPRIIGGSDLVPSGVVERGNTSTPLSWPSQSSQQPTLVHYW